MMDALCFYFFSCFALLCAVGTIFAKKPVHAVLLLALTFFNISWLFLLLRAEFLALLLVIVYVGAVAVLFLFVVMMLDFGKNNKPASMRSKIIPLGIFFVFFVEMVMVGVSVTQSRSLGQLTSFKPFTLQDISDVLYTKYFFEFQVCGLILLAAVVAAVSLCLLKKDLFVRLQNQSSQSSRDPKDCVVLSKPSIGQGISY